MKKPPVPPVEPLPKFGWKPVELEVVFEPPPKAGAKPVEVVVASELVVSLVVEDDGVKPVTDVVEIEDS